VQDFSHKPKCLKATFRIIEPAIFADECPGPIEILHDFEGEAASFPIVFALGRIEFDLH
jgi:hypothetical protein